MRHRTHRRVNRATARGFSLVEIMVAVVVICVGLLGVAKMQALALSSSNIARQRSMAAFLAASLASSMHSNRTFWASATAAADSPISISSATSIIAPAGLAGVASGACNGGNSAVPTCPGNAGSQTLAASDLTEWSTRVSQLLPNAVTSISCPGNVLPASCTIQMTWTEQAVMTNAQAQNASGTGQINNGGQFETPTYTLYVEP
ncbi:MAG: type IV pilus modification protein PilV [Steroidobacteraceae bacterium]|jgi:type IV pilus assembly protein PilV